MDSYEVLKEDDLAIAEIADGSHVEEQGQGPHNLGMQTDDICLSVESKAQKNGLPAVTDSDITTSIPTDVRRSSKNSNVSESSSENRQSMERQSKIELKVTKNSLEWDTSIAISNNDNDDDIDEHSFVFVSGKTSEFGLGSSDADQLIGSPTNKKSILWTGDVVAVTSQKVVPASSSENSGKDDLDFEDDKDTSERDNQAFTTESEFLSPESSLCENEKQEKQKVEKSPLLPDHNLLKDLVKGKGQQPAGIGGGVNKHNDKTPLLPSPAKTDISSDEDSTLMSVSLDVEMDSLRSPGQPSSDIDEEDQGVCSKYSQLSEDGSSPSNDDDKTQVDGHSKNSKKPSIFENALELSVAFSEFVDVESFVSSLGQEYPQTEDKFGGRFEDHLLILLRSASHKNLKSLLRRSGWPAESDARSRLWENLCVHLVKAGGNLYEEMAQDLYSKQKPEEDTSLPHFVDPKLLPSYHLNTLGVQTVQTILKVIGHLNPDVLHCPLLYPLAAAFLHYMGANSCFNCMHSLLRSSSPSYLTATKTSTKAVSLVLRDLAKKYVKSAYVFVTRGVDESVFDHWMYWLFQDLPFYTVVCIIDCFLLEGYKVLYRVVLAILSRFTKHMKKSRSSGGPPEDMKKAISSFCSSLSLESKKLLKIGFSIRGLTRKEISKLESRHQTHIKNFSPSDGPLMSSQDSNHALLMSDLAPELVMENGMKALLTSDMINTIWSWIPKRLTLKNLTLLYTSDEHGITLRTLLGRSEFAEQTLLVIKNDQEEIFGAFCSMAWHERRAKNKPHTSFFGTGETFVFTLKPSVKKYGWVGADGRSTDWSADLYMAADDTLLIVGSGHGEAIQLDPMMNRCRTTRCDTFNNEPLCSQEDFCCSVVQVYGFVD